MKIMAIPPLDDAILVYAAELKQGGIIIYPTDTLYGIGADARNEAAAKRICEIKGKESGSPLSAIFASWEQASQYAKISEEQQKALEKITPGPYTFLLPVKKRLPISRENVLGCRIPDNEFCIKLCQKFGYPVISTSANLHGKRAPECIEEIDDEILQSADLIIDGGQCKYGGGSTIIDVQGKKIARKGASLQKALRWLEEIK